MRFWMRSALLAATTAFVGAGSQAAAEGALSASPGGATPQAEAFAATEAAASGETLAAAAAGAYRDNPNLQAARARVRAAGEGRRQVFAGYLPELSFSASGGVSAAESEVNGVTTPREGLGPASASVQLRQSLFTGGRRGAQSRIAEGQVGVALARLRAAEQSVLLAVVSAFVDVRRDQNRVAIRANSVEVLARQLQAARDRFEVGEITLTDVAQAEARLAGAQAGLAAAQAQLQASRASFEEIVGEAPGELAAPPPVPSLPAGLSEALSAALAANPDLIGAEEAARVSGAQVDIERAALRPQVGIVGSVQRAYETSAPDLRADSASAAAQVTLPLYEGGLARSRTRAARQNLAGAEADLETARRQVIADVTAAWSAVLAAQRVIDASQTQVRANALAFEGVEQEQQVGLRTTLDVLDAEQELLESRLALVGAERDHYVAAHRLLAAMGALEPVLLGVNEDLSDPFHHEAEARIGGWSRSGED